MDHSELFKAMHVREAAREELTLRTLRSAMRPPRATPGETYYTVLDLKDELGMSRNRANEYATYYELTMGVHCPRGPNNERCIPPHTYAEMVSIHRQAADMGVDLITALTAYSELRVKHLEAMRMQLAETVQVLEGRVASLLELVERQSAQLGERLSSLEDTRLAEREMAARWWAETRGMDAEVRRAHAEAQRRTEELDRREAELRRQERDLAQREERHKAMWLREQHRD